MAWADTVSKSSVLNVFCENVANVCLPTDDWEGWWASGAAEYLCWEKGKEGSGLI